MGRGNSSYNGASVANGIGAPRSWRGGWQAPVPEDSSWALTEGVPPA